MRPFWVWLISSHCGLTVAVVETVVFLADKLVGLLVLHNYRVVNLTILIVQLTTGKVLHDASPQ